jgi:hypothetical protein
MTHAVLTKWEAQGRAGAATTYPKVAIGYAFSPTENLGESINSTGNDNFSII